ncbi:MAG: RNA polymerase sigma factor SigJ [Microthrixaceae bacterium]
MPDSTDASEWNTTATTLAEAGAGDRLFEGERRRLFGLAYRMLGSVAEADDVVQDAWIRYHRTADSGPPLRRPEAWLTTVVTRLAIDRLRSARHRREVYVGPWLPEPLLTDCDPAHVVELDDSVRMAFLHALERLSPVERAVFLLHEVFATPFAEIADTVGRTESHCRQIAVRARRRVRSERPRVVMDEARRRRLLDAFVAAVMGGGLEDLEALLTDDVVLFSDGGAEQRAARHPVRGSHRVARLVCNLAHHSPEGIGFQVAEVNGDLGFVFTMEGVPVMVQQLAFDGERVCTIYAVNNPAKLRPARAAHVAAGGRDPSRVPEVLNPPHLSTRRSRHSGLNADADGAPRAEPV